MLKRYGASIPAERFEILSKTQNNTNEADTNERFR